MHLDEEEFELINIIASGHAMNQRAISLQMGLSLGTTNFIIKRLVNKGALRVRQLNRKKLEYLITAQGAIEKSRKAYSYTLKTIASFLLLRNKVKDLILEKYEEGHNKIGFYGTNDLSEVFDLTIKDQDLRRLPLKFYRVASPLDAKNMKCTFIFLTQDSNTEEWQNFYAAKISSLPDELSKPERSFMLIAKD